MAELRLYRRIYTVGFIRTGSTIEQSYTLIDPTSISATTFSTLDNSTILETFTTLNTEGTGVYYVDINPSVYSWDGTYNVAWDVQYTSEAPIKRLLTTFRFNPIVIGSEIEVEIINSPLIL